MFLVQAIANFSESVVNPSHQTKQKNHQQQPNKQSHKQQNTPSHQQPQKTQIKQAEKQQQNNTIVYLEFEKGDKILVRETYQNGWWFGNTLKKAELKGYFPSNYVKVGAKPPPPKNIKRQKFKEDQEHQEEELVYDPKKQDQQDWMSKQLKQIKQIKRQPIKSQYYHGIKGYKMVKIDEKNQNILKANHVKFDVATGLASVPIKDQSPTSKAVRQMGYYFDYHQWGQQRNMNPPKKARPDARKKKQKKLNLKLMD